ncbi:MAG: ABC transporter permease [Acidobacteriota bacterium]
MILKLAWRNIWRQKRRTWILITAVTIGFFGLFFFMVITEGAVKQAVKNIIDSGIGHIQIHRQGYLKDPEVKKIIKNPDSVIDKLNFPEIELISKRVNLQGVLYSPQETSPVQVIGGVLEKEKLLTKFEEYIVEGDFPKAESEILIGNKLAEILDVKLNEKVVLSSSDINAEISSYAFRVGGIFKSPSMEVNKFIVLIDITAASKISSYKNMANEIVIRLKEEKFIPDTLNKIKDILNSEYEVLSWGDVNPSLKYQFEVLSKSMLLFGFIILFGASFGIMNVFFMSIFERMREFAILRAMGLKPFQLKKLIVLEGILIGLISIIIGSFLNSFLYLYLSFKGLNLSVFARSLEMWGSGSIIYPSLSFENSMGLISLVIIVVFLSIILPARKSAKIIITEALRYV